MWTSGAISTEMYVNKLYGDSLSEEEKLQEIAKLEQNKQMDTMNLGDFGLNDDKDIIGGGSGEETPTEKPTRTVKE